MPEPGQNRAGGTLARPLALPANREHAALQIFAIATAIAAGESTASVVFLCVQVVVPVANGLPSPKASSRAADGTKNSVPVCAVEKSSSRS